MPVVPTGKDLRSPVENEQGLGEGKVALPPRAKLLSVVAPVYQEEDTLHEFYRRLKAVADGLKGWEHELVFVDDGSKDQTLNILEGLCKCDNTVRVISLSRNFGHQCAITAGLDYAGGNAVVIIDSDLQDPPEIIPAMIDHWEQGSKVVCAVRRSRKGESPFKRLTATTYYRLLSLLSNISLPLDSGDFRLLDRHIVTILRTMREESRYLRGLIPWIGFKQTCIYYERDRRYAGRTHYSLGRMISLGMAGITSFSDRPLAMVGQLGFLLTCGSFVMIVWLIVSKLMHPETVIQGWTSLLVVILFLEGTQLLSLGLIGQYLARVFRETKRRPLYIVKQVIGEVVGNNP